MRPSENTHEREYSAPNCANDEKSGNATRQEPASGSSENASDARSSPPSDDMTPVRIESNDEQDTPPKTKSGMRAG